MGQFVVHRHRLQPDGPLLLNIQSDLVRNLSTRVVVPLYRHDERDLPIDSLTPTVTINGTRYLMEVPELAGVPLTALGEQVADLSDNRDVVLAALDLLITGI